MEKFCSILMCTAVKGLNSRLIDNDDDDNGDDGDDDNDDVDDDNNDQTAGLVPTEKVTNICMFTVVHG